MRFIGQAHITKRLFLLLKKMKDSGEGGGILFRGPSGYGKTHLAKLSASALAGGNYVYLLGDQEFNLVPGVTVYLVDEVHLCETPEKFYPILDKKNVVLIFTTNFDSSLPEALVNRCQDFTLTSYTESELIDMVKNRTKLNLSKIVILHLINLSGKNPRILLERILPVLEIIATYEPEIFQSDESIINKVDDVFGISSGLTTYCVEYLNALKSLGGRASLDVISRVTHLDKFTIKYEVEPVLLAKKLITISSKGRSLL